MRQLVNEKIAMEKLFLRCILSKNWYVCNFLASFRNSVEKNEFYALYNRLTEEHSVSLPLSMPIAVSSAGKLTKHVLCIHYFLKVWIVIAEYYLGLFSILKQRVNKKATIIIVSKTHGIRNKKKHILLKKY